MGGFISQHSSGCSLRFNRSPVSLCLSLPHLHLMLCSSVPANWINADWLVMCDDCCCIWYLVMSRIHDAYRGWIGFMWYYIQEADFLTNFCLQKNYCFFLNCHLPLNQTRRQRPLFQLCTQERDAQRSHFASSGTNMGRKCIVLASFCLNIWDNL